eukprot:3934148-Rhodomonas_salina.1
MFVGKGLQRVSRLSEDQRVASGHNEGAPHDVPQCHLRYSPVSATKSSALLAYLDMGLYIKDCNCKA